MWEKFTQSSKKAIKYATEEAKHYRSNAVDTEHLLLGLLRDDKAFAMKILQHLEVPVDKLRNNIVEDIKIGNYEFENLTFSDASKEVLENAYKEARALKHSHIGTEHLLLGLIKVSSGKAAKHLRDFGVTYQTARGTVTQIINQQGKGTKQKTKTPTLDEFGHDLTREAKERNLDPVIGRSIEINRIIQILSKRTKNNPVLIGEPGVGKTAIVEGLAQMIAVGEVPEPLKGARLISLDLAGLVAGTKFRGEFEDRLKRVMREIMTSDQKIVLFIDELHTIIGAGAAEGAIDASNILKPALARGKLRAIGATTTNEYKKHVEKNGALERRFQPVMVNEPTVDETINILKGLRKRYEEFHLVEITDEALESAARFSHRFVTARSLPDKAIDLMDEAAAKVHVGLTLKELDKKIAASSERPSGTRFNGGDSEEEDELPEPIEGFGDDDDAGDEDSGPGLPESIRRDLQGTAREGVDAIKVRRVTDQDIAEVVHAWTGIPVSAIAEEETEKLLRMEDYLHHRLIGQDEAIGAIARALRRSRVGLKDPKRPTGSFLFTGPTGVGKTELAKALAEFLFGDEQALIRFDMSEYMEKFSVSRLVGAPPGYVGYDEGGQLTEAVKRRPYSVILMDEIEKAHHDVFNILLQVMEDGIITDSQGRTVDLRNTILILTSNLGTGEIGLEADLGFRAVPKDDKTEFDPEAMRRQYTPKVKEALKKVFRPEFLNRLDEIVIFSPLSYAEIVKILDKFLKRIEGSVAQYGISLELTAEAREKLVEEGFSKTQGARPLRRTLQRRIEDPLSEALLRHDFEAGDTVQVVFTDGKFDFTKVQPAVAV